MLSYEEYGCYTNNKKEVLQMKILLILAHPNKESFNHAIANTAFKTLEGNGYEVIFHDL